MVDSHGMICAICNRVIHSHCQLTTKNSSCCGKLKTVHIKCASTYFLFTDPEETFQIEDWTSKTAIKLYCCKCERSYVFVRGKHIYKLIPTSPYTIVTIHHAANGVILLKAVPHKRMAVL